MRDGAVRGAPTRREYVTDGEFDPERYPDVPAEYQLSDRRRFADGIDGDI